MNCDKGITRGGHLLSKIIRRVRRTADMSQRELAKHAGVSASAIGDLETGAVTPSLAVLQRILNAANYRLVVVDAGGRLVLPLEVWQDVTDLAGRRFPAHLDTILDPELGEWWADSYGLTRPSETFRRNRAARTTNAESANGRCARPSSDSRRTRGVRPVGGRATNGATTAQRIRNSTNGGEEIA